MSFECINQQVALELMREQEALIVDIRDLASYRASHITNAVHLDNASIQDFLESADKAKPVIVCCYHGNSSKGAADYLSSRGFVDCYSLDGGFSLWQYNGLAAESS